MSSLEDGNVSNHGNLLSNFIESNRLGLSSSPGNNSVSSFSGGFPNHDETQPLLGDASDYQLNFEAFEPQEQNTPLSESSERDALIAVQEPYRGVVRELGKYQIFVRDCLKQK